MQEWTNQHDVAGVDIAGVDNAGVDKSARCGKGGHFRSRQYGTMWQGWTMREWTMQEYSNACENVLKTSYKSADMFMPLGTTCLTVFGAHQHVTCLNSV